MEEDAEAAAAAPPAAERTDAWTSAAPVGVPVSTSATAARAARSSRSAAQSAELAPRPAAGFVSATLTRVRALLGLLLLAALLGCGLLFFLVGLVVGALPLALAADSAVATLVRRRRSSFSFTFIVVCKRATRSGTSRVIRVSLTRPGPTRSAGCGRCGAVRGGAAAAAGVELTGLTLLHLSEQPSLGFGTQPAHLCHGSVGLKRDACVVARIVVAVIRIGSQWHSSCRCRLLSLLILSLRGRRRCSGGRTGCA